MEYYGITEIQSFKASHYMPIILRELSKNPSLYISMKPFPISQYTEILKEQSPEYDYIHQKINQTLIFTFSTFIQLQSFIKNEIMPTVKAHKIKLVVLHEIDFIFYEKIDNKYAVTHKDVFQIMRVMQNLVSLDVNVLVKFIHKKASLNSNLRLSMEYYINWRYLIYEGNGVIEVKDLMINQK